MNRIIITKEVLHKINLYHSLIERNIEWSGHILIKPEKGKRDTTTTYRVIDIVLETIGTAGFFEVEEVLNVGKLAKHPEHDQCVVGLIHSHHNMKAFFSDTDIEEIEDNDFSPYISLVVSYDQKFVAKECYNVEEHIYKIRDVFGRIITVKDKSRKIIKDLEVIIEGEDDVRREVKEIKEQMKSRSKEKMINTNKHFNYNHNYNNNEKKFDKDLYNLFNYDDDAIL
jgi:proteasome lid subunit RPN8/RPN11